MRYIAISGCLLILSTAAVASDNTGTLLAKGRDAIAVWNLADARRYYAEACSPQTPGSESLLNRALCEHSIASLEDSAGHAKEAEVRYRQALELWDQLGDAYLPSRIRTLMNLGCLYRDTGRPEESGQLLRQSLDLALHADPVDPLLVAEIRTRLGDLYSDTGNPETGRPLLNEAIAALRGQPSPYGRELAYAYSSLGMIDLHSGLYKSAEANLRQSVALATQALGEEHPNTAGYQTNLGLALYLQGRYDSAVTVLRRARFVLEKTTGPDSIQLGSLLAELAAVESAQGKFAAAEQDGLRTLAILEHARGKGSLEYLLERVNLAGIYINQHKTAEAEKTLPADIEAERLVVSDKRILAEGIHRLAALRALQHKWPEADALYAEAIGLYEQSLGPTHPDIAPVLRAYAEVLKQRGAPRADIRSLESRAKAMGFASRP